MGTYTLLSAGPATQNSPSGLFAVDNLISPGTPLALLDTWGLLFGQPGTGSQSEINIWGNGNGDYAFYSEVGGGYNIQQGSGGTFTLTEVSPVPESASGAVWCLMGLCVAGWIWHRGGQKSLIAG